MRKFLLGTLYVLAIMLVSVMVLLALLDRMGWSDSDYKRFTSGRQQSVIVGTSRAAQGIRPEVINSYFAISATSKPVYNFSFTVNASPYGEVYYEAIRKKVEANPSKGSLSIISVDPYSLSDDTALDSERRKRESSQMLNKVRLYTRPQFGYLLRYCRPQVWRTSRECTLHDDGWLEIKDIPMDKESVAVRADRKMTEYGQITILPSEWRAHWLREIVELLQNNGEVYLCRIPVSEAMKAREDEMWPTFEDDMSDLADGCGVRYISFADFAGQYRTTDGNHLFKEDAMTFTECLCDSIAKYSLCKINSLQ